jgi:hypothetical protein
MARVRWIFLRLLGGVYLIAFASFYPQIPGLIGGRGILPAAGFLEAVHRQLGTRGYYLLPTLAWLHPSDRFLQLLAAGGIVFALLAILGRATGFSFLMLWVLYLSLVSAGRDFMAFQWDILLLETGFLALFFAPWQWGREQLSEPPVTVLWLLRWLMFRLMLLSGAAKLLSRDPTWRDFTALQVHYQTQPIPNVPAWYMHQLPGWFHQLSLLAMFGIELLAPFLIFAPWKRVRYTATAVLAAFQVLLILTGNYAFFNLLTLALCVPLLGDFLPQPKSWRREAAGLALALLIVPLSLLEMAARFGVNLPQWADRAIQWQAPFHLVNSYGLFAVMTTTRPEIVIEGSHDGAAWQAYEFRYKPGDPRRPPPWVAPHQPRLDWQMWFAALGPSQQSPWFSRLVKRLLEGSPEALRLLKSNPFSGRPPRFIRAQLYDYRFTTRSEKAASGDWWRRQLLGEYFPAVSQPPATSPPL